MIDPGTVVGNFLQRKPVPTPGSAVTLSITEWYGITLQLIHLVDILISSDPANSPAVNLEISDKRSTCCEASADWLQENPMEKGARLRQTVT